jgi:ABC-type Fe3+-hydroxamate transport system substrate-binding protein
MNDDNMLNPADAPAPASESEATAAPIAETTRPEDQTTDTPKSFTQEELDAIVGKRLAREQRKWEREQAQRTVPTAPSELPPPDQFDSVETYAKAYAEQMLREREVQKQRSEYVEAYHDREEDARGKYDDFEQVAYNPNLRITTVMAEVLT